MLLWSFPWAAEECLLFLPGPSPPLPFLASVSEGVVSLTFTSSTAAAVFYPFLNMLLQGHHL